LQKKNNSIIKIILILVFGTLIGGVAYIFVSPQFEKKAPEIVFKSNGYWNLKDDLNIELNDDSGIKYYKIIFKNEENEKTLKTEVLKTPVKNLQLKLPAPELNPFFKSQEVNIVVHAVDNSRWNFFEGNEIVESFDVKIDMKRPVANVIANSLAIRKGGSAVAVVKIEDDNLDSAYISFNNDDEVFALTPFYKENYYVALIAWDVDIENFEQVSVVATDKAGNKTKSKIPLYIRPLKSKTDDITLNENFIKNVSANVLEQSHMIVPNDLKSIFLESNKVLRAQNIQTIKEDTRKYMNRSAITQFNIKPFKRLPGSRTAAGFAERRHYYLNGEKIDEAWHLGVDWASVKQASIYTSNSGRVIANKYVGIYGNSVIVDHGMGLASLYGHLSSTKVNAGDEVRSNDVIGQTGTTGAVLGDHLHFGVLVQGIEVNPLEWMDHNWIKTRITDILDEAKKVIDAQ
jgi:murein DD-endopeptidase MepM/ murein hydrolase activator NlpD